MRLRLTLAVLLAFTLTSLTTLLAADSLVLQGRLTDGDGFPLTGTYDLTVRVYDRETGGTAVWADTFLGVTVKNGICRVVLGSGTPLTLGTETSYWVGIQVGAASELTPRLRLARGHLAPHRHAPPRVNHAHREAIHHRPRKRRIRPVGHHFLRQQ